MPLPNPDYQRGISLEKVESVGVFRCPNCATVEKENKELRNENETLKKRIADLQKYVDDLLEDG